MLSLSDLLHLTMIDSNTSPDIMHEQMRRIKLDPNPRGEENFFFINALNEWGEGNVLEPSIQWEDGFSKAFREAVTIAEKLPWKVDMIAAGQKLEKEISTRTSPVDVCAIVRVFKADWPFSDPFGLSETLRSLREQSNKKWRAVVVPAANVDQRILKVHVMDAFDPRVVLAEVPEEILNNETAGGWHVTDWVIENLAQINSSCANATHLLVASADTTYSPTTFDVVARDNGEHARGEIVGLNFETTETIRLTEKPMAWNERCDRFMDGDAQPCIPATVDVVDVGAVLLDLAKFQRGKYKFADKGPALLKELVKAAWLWTSPTQDTCNLIQGGTYSSCITTGRFWLDAPEGDDRYESACHSLNSIVSKYGWDNKQWDMVSWKNYPYCIRLSEEMYNRAANSDGQ
jgi:hypothetical protein